MESARKILNATLVLQGGIPSGIGTLPALETLALQDNVLTGTLPPELGDLAQLQTLTLSGNLLTGSVPSDESSHPNWTREKSCARRSWCQSNVYASGDQHTICVRLGDL